MLTCDADNVNKSPDSSLCTRQTRVTSTIRLMHTQQNGYIHTVTQRHGHIHAHTEIRIVRD